MLTKFVSRRPHPSFRCSEQVKPVGRAARPFALAQSSNLQSRSFSFRTPGPILEINPLISRIKELNDRLAVLRGYL